MTSIPRSPVRHLVSVEPATAERDAQIAATLSYHRAHVNPRHSRDMAATPSGPRSFASSIGNASPAGRGLSSASDVAPSHQASSSCPLVRQQSVRFAGPHARPKRPLAPRANQLYLLPASPEPSASRHLPEVRGQLNSSDSERHIGASAATRSLRRASYFSANSPNLDIGPVGPTQASFGRLRKSRSTFTCSVQPSSHFDLGDGPAERLKDWLSNSLHGLENKENEPASQSGPFALQSHRSMGILRAQGHSSTESQRGDSVTGHDEHRRNLKSQPSSLHRPKRGQGESSVKLPRSLRNSRNGSAALSSAFSGSSIPISKRTGLRLKARKVSSTLKSKFRGLFRPKGADDAVERTLGLPNSSGSDSDVSCRRINNNAPELEEASVSCVPSRVPSLHAVSSSQQLRSRQGSLESLRFEQNLSSNDRSRVTSWTDSSAHTMASGTSHADWERQRLSVIRENGTHVSSCTAARPANALVGSGAVASSLSQSAAIDSQCVYAALMKRLEETQQRANAQPKPGTGGSHNTTSRGGLGEHITTQACQLPTIRCVRAEDDVFQECTSSSSPRVTD